MDVRLPDGRILKGVPDGTTKAQLAEKLKRNGIDVPDDWMKPAAPSTDYRGFMPPQFPMNPLPFNVEGGIDQLNRAAGVTAEAKPTDAVTAIPELALTAGTGTLGTILGGAAGALQAQYNAVVPKSWEGPAAADRIRQVQQAITYRPRTAGGQAATAVASLPSELISKGTTFAGEKTTDATGSPMLGAAVKTVGELIPGMVAARVGGVRAPESKPSGSFVDKKYDVPTTDQLKTAANETYTAAEQSGVVIRPESTQRVVTMMEKVAEKENLGKLPAKLNEAANVLRERVAEGKPLTLMEADKVRQLIGDAMKSTDAADRRLAKIIQKRYDKYLDNLQPADTLSGDAGAATALLKDARELWKRGKNSETIDTMERKAKRNAETNFSQAGIEHALRMEFKRLANNERKMAPYTPEQQAAISKVAAPGFVANAARFAGKFDPTSGFLPAVASVATGGLLPAAGFVGRRISNAITRGNVDKARAALVGRGMPQPKPAMPSRGAVAQQPSIDALPFTATPGVMPARAGILSNELERQFGESPVSQPRQMTADVPPQMGGGILYKPAPDVSRAGDLSLEGPAPKYPGGIDFTPTNLSPKYAEQLAAGLEKSGGKKKGLFDPIEESTPASRPPRERSSTQIKLEQQRLLAQMRSVPPGADALYVQGLKRRWDELQVELSKRLSQESSGGATSQRPTR